MARWLRRPARGAVSTWPPSAGAAEAASRRTRSRRCAGVTAEVPGGKWWLADEMPGAGHLADRHFDEHWLGAARRLAEQSLELRGRGGARARDAKGLGQLHEVRIDQLGADAPPL